MTPRRFPPPWSVEELEVCFVAENYRRIGDSPNVFDDFAVAFNDQFRGVTLVKHAEAWF